VKESAQASGSSSELVPIADRMRYLQGFRAFVALGVMLFAMGVRHSFDASILEVGAATSAWLLLSVTTTAAWRVSRRAAILLFGFMLMADGVYLAWASYASGGAGSPVRYLVILHLITVALLASYRTGLKLALWHSLLLFVAYYGQKDGLLRPFTNEHAALTIGTPLEQLIAFIAAFWFVTITTASFSAVNERELRRRRYDLEALAGMVARVSEATGSAGVAEEFLASVVDTFDFERALLIMSQSNDECEVIAHIGATVPDSVGPRPLPGSVLAAAMSTSRTQLVSHLDSVADAWLDSTFPAAKNLVVVPLSADRRTMGVVVAEHGMRRGSRIERRVVGMLERFADYGVVALRNAWLLDEIHQLAVTDPLTGIANRLRFGEVLDQELERAARARQDVTLAMLDIDHFKRVNDTLGHQAGDRLLCDLAALVSGHCRTNDSLARYGGEEFALILPNTGAADALTLLDRLRRLLAASDHGVTMSVGLATFPADAATADLLVAAADEALYESKRAGRNRVTAVRPSLDAVALLAESSTASPDERATGSVHR